VVGEDEWPAGGQSQVCGEGPVAAAAAGPVTVTWVMLAMRMLASAEPADAVMSAAAMMGAMVKASTTHADLVHIRTVLSLSFHRDQRRTLLVRRRGHKPVGEGKDLRWRHLRQARAPHRLGRGAARSPEHDQDEQRGQACGHTARHSAATAGTAVPGRAAARNAGAVRNAARECRQPGADGPGETGPPPPVPAACGGDSRTAADAAAGTAARPAAGETEAAADSAASAADVTGAADPATLATEAEPAAAEPEPAPAAAEEAGAGPFPEPAVAAEAAEAAGEPDVTDETADATGAVADESVEVTDANVAGAALDGAAFDA